MLPDSLTAVCRCDTMVKRFCDSQSSDMAQSVADCSSAADMSHTKQCIIHTDLSSDVTAVCGVLLPRIQGTPTTVLAPLVSFCFSYLFETTYISPSCNIMYAALNAVHILYMCTC